MVLLDVMLHFVDKWRPGVEQCLAQTWKPKTTVHNIISNGLWQVWEVYILFYLLFVFFNRFFYFGYISFQVNSLRVDNADIFSISWSMSNGENLKMVKERPMKLQQLTMWGQGLELQFLPYNRYSFRTKVNLNQSSGV